MVSTSGTLTRSSIVLSLALTGWLAGCGGPSIRVAPPPAARVWPVEASNRLYRDDAAPLPDTIRRVIRDATTFQQIWSQATSALDDPPASPEIDFDEHMIVFVGAGRSDPGDQIQVDSIGLRRESNPRNPDQEVEVVYVVVRTILENDPFPGESYPIEIVRVDRWDLPVRWEERRDGGL
ncbi:MAG: hypothetical protein R6T96_09090 [Longimicrobiales bacterium]